MTWPPPKYCNRFSDNILQLPSMTYMDFECKITFEDMNIPVDIPQDRGTIKVVCPWKVWTNPAWEKAHP